MKYNVRMVNRLYMDLEIEAENVPEARKIASDIANKAKPGEWADWGDVEVFEIDFEEDGILVTI